MAFFYSIFCSMGGGWGRRELLDVPHSLLGCIYCNISDIESDLNLSSKPRGQIQFVLQNRRTKSNCPPKPEDKSNLSSEIGGQVLQFQK